MKFLSELLKVNISEADKISSASEYDIINKDYQLGQIEKMLRDDENAPENMGKWSIMKIGKNVIIKNRALTIKLNNDEVFNVFEKLSLGRPVKVTTSSDLLFFKPLKRGKEYAIKSDKMLEIFPNGILLTNKQIDDFMDFIAINEIHEI